MSYHDERRRLERDLAAEQGRAAALEWLLNESAQHFGATWEQAERFARERDEARRGESLAVCRNNRRAARGWAAKQWGAVEAARLFPVEKEGEQMAKRVRCNKCGFVGADAEFRHGNDFFQNRYVSGCPKCDNRQSPGDAAMRAFGGERPFSFVDDDAEPSDPLEKVLRRSGAAS